MFMTILLTLAVLTGGFFAYRYLTLRHALRATRDELALIRRDLTQNQMLHLPLPNAELAALLDDLNQLLAEIQQERQNYAARERAFQRQIEAVSHDLRTPLLSSSAISNSSSKTTTPKSPAIQSLRKPLLCSSKKPRP